MEPEVEGLGCDIGLSAKNVDVIYIGIDLKVQRSKKKRLVPI